jgi:hypothetical protein
MTRSTPDSVDSMSINAKASGKCSRKICWEGRETLGLLIKPPGLLVNRCVKNMGLGTYVENYMRSP